MQGKTILHYKILEKIGQGGMGVVYKAEDTKLKRTVALKFLLPHILSGEEEKSRFIHEAQAAAGLHHPNICTIHEINETDGQTFISMAYLEGESLNERIDRGPLGPVEALRIALQVTRGLRAAHEKGIIHRDIKSSNIKISGDGQATILDFGLAKSVHQTHATQRGTKMGTIGYMSPEQTRGDTVDHRTDIWSLGVLLYEMITGRRPFRGDYDEAVIYSIINEEPERIAEYAPDLPEDVWFAIQRATAKDPDDRYQTAAEMAEDLELLYDDLRTDSSSSRRKLHASRIERPSESLLRTIFNNRVIVVLAMYLVAGLVVVLAIGFFTDRYVLSPDPARIVAVALLSLIPTVWIMAARKRARIRPWSRVIKVGVPVNLVVSAVVLFTLFAGRGIGAATEAVTVLDEAGRPVERMVPKSEYRKSMMLFFLDNNTGEEDNTWVGGAIMILLQVDLFQDQFLYLRSGVDEPFRQRLQEAGFSDWFDAPWNFKRKTAEDAHTDYLLTGSYTFEEGAWVVTLRVHDSRSGRLVAENVHRGENLFVLADEASLQLRRSIGLPEKHVATTKDLPVAEMFTNSTEALRVFCVGIYLALFQQDWPGSLGYLERAVAADTTFSWGYMTLFQLYQANNVPDKADPAMRSAMQHIYKLPERVQFLLKVLYYDHVRDPDRELGVLRMMVDLYPDDVQAREILAAVRRGRNELQLAVEQYKKALEIDPSRTELLLETAHTYRQMGDFDRAARAYRSYIEKHPEDPDAYHSLGVLFELWGKYEDAREQYEKVLVIDPSHARVMADIGDIENKVGNDERALEIYQKALEAAKTPQERARVYRSVRNFYSSRGQIEKSLEQLRLFWAEQEKYEPPVSVQVDKLDDLCFFVWAGREAEAFEILESVKSQLVPPYDGFLPLGQVCIYVELNDADKTEAALEQLRANFETYHFEVLSGAIYWAEGEVEEARGNYLAAIKSYRKKLEQDPNDVTMYRSIGRCYRKLGRYDDAVSAFDKMLKVHPLDAKTHYELALLHHEKGENERAMDHLEKALQKWKNADPGYEPARKARATLAQWQS